MNKHIGSKKYNWLFVSITALTAIAFSTQFSGKVNAAVQQEGASSNIVATRESKDSASATDKEMTNSVSSEDSNKENGQVSNTQATSQVISNQKAVKCHQTKTNSIPEATEKHAVEENISDSNATQEAKDLFGYLKGYTKSDKIIFGQQQANVNGVTLTPDEEKGSIQSDVRKLTGRNPALIGYDVGVIDGDREAGLRQLAKSMNAFHDEGGTVVISAHPNNFVTGGDYSDTKGDTVKNILPGGTANAKYNKWLDSIVDLSKELKDKDGKPYAAIYRVFHEQTGAWFWWGSGSTSTDQYIALYRYTVDYFRDHGVHNFLYAYTPGGNLTGDRDRYMKTYPGDNYVDVFGTDIYDTGVKQGTKAWLDGVNKDLDTVVNIAEEKGKIPAFAEFGVHLTQDPKQNNCNNWYTKLLNSIEADPIAKKISYMQTWTNFGFPDNVYVPYKGYGDSAIIKDFTQYINDSRIVSTPSNDFDNYLKEQHQYKTGVHQSVVTVMSPTNYDTVENNKIPFTVRVDNQNNADKVEVTIAGKTTVLTKEQMAAGINFTGNITVPDNANNTAPKAVIKVFNSQGEILDQQDLQLYFKFAPKPQIIASIPVKATAIKLNGTWPDVGNIELTQDGDNVSVSFKAFDPSASWQEVKFETVDSNPKELAKSNQVEITGYISADSGNLEAYGIDNDGNKTDYSSNKVDINSMPTVTINGKQYKEFDFVINFPEELKRTSLQFGLVGINAKDFNQILLNKIQLKHLSKEEVINPKDIDDYSSYLGSDHLLDRAYSTNGDATSVSLIKNANGGYSMKYVYDIGPNHYAGRGLTFSTPRDWSGAKGISLNLKNDSYPGDDLDLQAKMGDVTFEGHVDLKNSHDGQVFVPFTAFAPAGWDTAHKGQKVTPDLLKKVNTFWFFINSQVEGKRSITISDVKAIDEVPSIPDQPTSKPNNPEAPSIPDQPISEQNNFETTGSVDIVVQNSNTTSASINEIPNQSIEIKLTHNAYVYDKNLNISYQDNQREIIHANEKVTILDNGRKYKISNKEFYRIGDNRYIKVANTIGYYCLKHNSFLYDRKGKAIKRNGKRVLYKKGKRISLRSNKVIKVKGKQFLVLDSNFLIKARNIKHIVNAN